MKEKNENKSEAKTENTVVKPYLAALPEEIAEKVNGAMISFRFGLLGAMSSGIGTMALKLGYNKKTEIAEDFSYLTEDDLLKLGDKLDFENPCFTEAFESVDRKEYEESKADFFILTHPENGQRLCVNANGFYLEDGDSTKFVAFTDMTGVEERSLGLSVTANAIYECGSVTPTLAGETVLRISSPVCHNTVRVLRHLVERMLEIYGNPVKRDLKDEITAILAKHIKSVSKSSPVYLEDDFWTEKGERVLNNALHKFALKVRRDEALAVIDTSLFGNGKDGILFSVDGIAFDYAFQKVFLKYDEIREIIYPQNGKKLIFAGNFSECKNPEFFPEIDSIYYNLDELKAIVEEILYLV